MTDSESAQPQDSNRRKARLLAGLLAVAILGVMAPLALLASLSPPELILACTTDSFRLPQPLACWWIDGPGRLDPMASTPDDEGMTLFMFTLSGFSPEEGANPAGDGARTLRLLRGWSDEVDWTAVDRFGLTPLHAAVLHNEPALVQALLEMGAPRDVAAGAGTEAFAGQTPAEMVETLRQGTSGASVSADDAASRAEIAAILSRHP